MDELVNQPGWVYICMNAQNPNECKIGSTKRPLYNRLTETGNPDYMIVKAYQVPPEETLKLERHLQREVGKVAVQKVHLLTGKKSEWFICSPKVAAQALEHELAKCLGRQDEDGCPDLASITFKPSLDEGNQMKLATRIHDKSHFHHVVKAIVDA